MDSETQSGIDIQIDREESKELSEKYEIITKCGNGGCSKVFEARRLSDDAQVALKVLCLPEVLDESEANLTKRRFYAEARVLQKLTDDHSVQCYEYGVYKGSPCYVMEFVNGIELNNHLRNSGALTYEVSVGIMRQVLQVLSEAHDHGIIHRDIKPENILVLVDSEPPEVRLIDFGIATIHDRALSGMQATQLGIIRGTPSYMAPEMFSGKVKASPESDIYACGLVLLECLTGNIAVPGNNIVSIANKHAKEDLYIPGIVPDCLSKIILKCCEKEPKNRYHNCRDIIRDLDEALPEAVKMQDILKRSYNTMQSSQGIQIRSKATLVALVLALLIVGAGCSALVIMNLMMDSDTQTVEASKADPASGGSKAAEAPAAVETIDKAVDAPQAVVEAPKAPEAVAPAPAAPAPDAAPGTPEVAAVNANQPQEPIQQAKEIAVQADAMPVVEKQPVVVAKPAAPAPKPKPKKVEKAEDTKSDADKPKGKKVDNSGIALSMF